MKDVNIFKKSLIDHKKNNKIFRTVTLVIGASIIETELNLAKLGRRAAISKKKFIKMQFFFRLQKNLTLIIIIYFFVEKNDIPSERTSMVDILRYALLAAAAVVIVEFGDDDVANDP